jgi:hypothetical protein
MSEGLRKKGSTKKPDKPGKSPATLRSLRKRLKGLLYIQGVTGGDEWNRTTDLSIMSRRFLTRDCADEAATC